MMDIFSPRLGRYFPSFSIYYTPQFDISANFYCKLQLAESDLAKQAQIAAANVAKGAQSGAKNAADNFNRFVEGSNTSGAATRTVPLDESKKDFWDSFAEAGNSRQSAIGTSAVKKTSVGGVAGGPGAKKEEDNWDKWQEI